MISPLAEHLETIRNKITSSTGVNVTHGIPDDSLPGLYLFPYNFSVDPNIHNKPMRGIKPQTIAAYNVKLLLIPSPSIDYEILNRGLDCINDNPVLKSKNGTVNVVLENVSTEELTSVFISAGISYRLSLALKMHYITNS